MVCHYARMKDLGTRFEHGFAVWDDASERFVKHKKLPLDELLYAREHPIRVTVAGEDWFYFPDPLPSLRVRARWPDVTEPSDYERYDVLRGGTRHAWITDGEPVRRADTRLFDVETGAPVTIHRATVTWNQRKRKWVMIALQKFGRSALGEVWFAEADTVLGPWTWARRVVTHDKYAFYNVKQHPYFASGSRIYFEGTYTSMFSAAKVKTPRYDYNQVMYRLDLSDWRLTLPVPIYELRDGSLARGREVEARDAWADVVWVPFYALEPEVAEGARLRTQVLARGEAGELRRSATGTPVFRALPPPSGKPHPSRRALYEWRDENGRRRYRCSGQKLGSGWTRGDRPIAEVWPSRDPDPARGPGTRPARR